MKLSLRSHFKSLRSKLIFGFLITTFPLIILLITNNQYAIQVVRKQVFQSNLHTINLYMGQIDRNLDEVDKYLYNTLSTEPDFLRLEHPINNDSQLYYTAKVQLFNKLSTDSNNYKITDSLFFYSAINNDLVTTSLLRYNFNERETIKGELKNILMQLQSKPDPEYRYDQWHVIKLNSNYYLYHIVKKGNVYLGAWTSAQRIMVPTDFIDLGKQGKALFVTDQLEPMEETNFFQSHGIQIQYDVDEYMMTGEKEKFLVVGQQSHKGKFSLLAWIPDSSILEKLPYWQRVLTFIALGWVVSLVIFIFFLRKVLLYPINKLVKAMKVVQMGNLNVAVTYQSSSDEFVLMNRTFNQMVSQIQDLKINVYEEQLQKQKEELKHLQLQMNPHFFLNSLNVMYNLAQVQKYELIMEISRSLVQYLRFMFRTDLTFVSLKDEINHTRNYLKIQALRFPNHLSFDISVPEDLNTCKVPPLVIQTFVENTIKHAVTLDEPIQLAITIRQIEGATPSIQLQIQDSGKGFPLDVLSRLQKNQGLYSEKGEHIGIANVQRRLHLLYQEKANLTFSNGENFGANVVIVLPIAT
ncbi:sensor histidine kinase [Paenibacillus planticolens]|uniref:HAMP domain-containing protein n=1 Tax=Paenibacillus planticolens TaxID=2654976 RepID=A0ABX1ZYV0_9BACL|nr:histidine kinase [Paenibacillus planticolens]NOV04235.1 HAMP domain-containing protein [Paenibacillus planticolens]